MSEGRNKIKDVVMQYTSNDKVDLSKLRKEEESTYRKIPHYFGSINGMLEELNLQSQNKKHTGGSTEKSSLRNSLAYDMLKEMLKTNTMEQVANQYGCSRMHVSQLLKSLKIAVGETEEEAN